MPRPPTSRPLLAALFAALLIGGCDRDDPAPSTDAACSRGFDDWAPGAGAVTSIALDPSAPLPPAGVAFSISTTLGEGDPDPFPFFRIGALLRLEGSPASENVTGGATLAVLDQGTQELHLFDEGGARIATMGGRGDGPGSFRSARRLVALGPDSVGVLDGALGRLTVFGPAGELARVTPLPSEAGSEMPAQGRLALLAPRSVGGWIGRLPLQASAGESLLVRDSLALVRVSADGAVSELDPVLGRHPDGDRWNLGAWSAMVGGVRLGGAGRLAGSRPTLVAPLPDGVAIARGDRFGVVVLDDDGEVRRRIALEAPCRPFTQEVAEQAAASRAAAVRMQDPEGGAGASLPVPADLAAEVRAFYLDAPRVPHLAAMDQLLGGADGSLWVRAFIPTWEEGSEHLWVSMGPDGQEVGRMTTPWGFRALWASSSALDGVLPDALGEESLVRIQLPD